MELHREGSAPAAWKITIFLFRGVKYKADRMIALEDQDISSSEEEDNYSASSSEEEVFELY